MFVGLMMFIGDSATSCNEDSEAVAYARSLSQERLKRLYYDMENYSSKTDLPIDGFQFYDKNITIPQEFDDLEVIKVRPDDGNIMIEGCFDHYVYLQFKGIGRFKRT